MNPHSNTFSQMRQVQEFSATRLHVGSEKDHTKPYLLGSDCKPLPTNNELFIDLKYEICGMWFTVKGQPLLEKSDALIFI